jgi:acyl-CoA synthetase (AMP-forming)/AMP-acid ligase II
VSAPASVPVSVSSTAPSTALWGRPPPEHLDATGNIAAFFAVWAERAPTRPCLIFPRGGLRTTGDDVVDNLTLANDAAATAADLKRRGLQTGQRVLLLVPPSPALYRSMLAVVASGATAVFVDPAMPRAHLDDALREADCQFFLGVPLAHLWALRVRALRAIPHRVVVRRTPPRAPTGQSPTLSITPVDPHSPALVSFTTGSTGAPKAIARSHAHLNQQGELLRALWPVLPNDVDMPMLPLFALQNLSAGVPSVFSGLDPRRLGRGDEAADERAAAAAAARVRRHRVTTLGGSPALVAAVASALAQSPEPHAVRAVAIGGAAPRPRELSRIEAAFSHARVEVVYGATEAEPIAHGPARDLFCDPARGVCVGAPIAAAEVVLRDVDDDGVGEVLVRGPHVHAAPGAFHATGDLARRDGGRLFLVGRTASRVVTSRGTLHPLVVEQLVLQGSDVIERATLVQVKDQAVLVVVPRGSAEVAGAAARVALADAGVVVDHVVARPALPLDPRHAAKVQRSVLVAELLRLDLGADTRAP